MPPKGSKMVRPTAFPTTLENGNPTREMPFAYTTFSVPPPINAKNISSQYLRTDNQTWVPGSLGNPAAKVRAALKKQRMQDDTELDEDQMSVDDVESIMDGDGESKSRASTSTNTIVIHAGSKTLRIGLSSDLYPTTMKQCLARRDALTAKTDPIQLTTESDTLSKSDLSSNIDSLRSDLKTIMRNLKLRGLGNGRQQAASYNANVTAETVPEHNDIFAVEWTIADKTQEDLLIGEKAERLDSFSSEIKTSRPWKLFYPIEKGYFNRRPYIEHYGHSAALHALLNDIRTIWSHALTSPRESDIERQEAGHISDIGLGIPVREWFKYNVVLVVPDLYIMNEIEELVRLLLEEMGFAGVLVQQEGVCATFGAGLSSSCVVHIGRERATISCVEEGLIIAESRMLLNYGGDDISRFFMQLLKRINFPHQTFDIEKRLADAWLADHLKEKLCTLDAAQLALLITDFHLRLPKQKTKKFALRTYDETVIAPMALFSPKVFALESRRDQQSTISEMTITLAEEDGDDADGIVIAKTAGADATIPKTIAMTLCVKHLMPPAPTHVPPPPQATSQISVPSSDNGVALAASSSNQGTPAATPAPQAKSFDPLILEPISLSEPQASTPSGALTPAVKEDENSMASERTTSVPSTTKGFATNGNKAAMSHIDVPWESSKVPLDFAVWNSIQASISNLGSASTSEERIRKMTSNIICTGGTALIPGIGFALEARVNNYLLQWFAHQGKDLSNSSIGPNATVVPPPRDMDPRLLAWKGMAVLARLDGAQEMWIPKRDWETFGVRALKEKSLFL